MNPSACRLLLVCDEAREVTALTQTLAGQGYAVSRAHSAAEAMSLLRSESFDLLLTDLMLPQINDIELLRQAAELDAANRALRKAQAELESFARCASHDLRTPLNAVVGFAELLLDAGAGPLNETQRAYLTHIMEGGARLRALTDDLLRAARTPK